MGIFNLRQLLAVQFSSHHSKNDLRHFKSTNPPWTKALFFTSITAQIDVPEAHVRDPARAARR